ncbi:MAG: glycosyltransferase family 2 protein [Gammaproteobacteria bacterium]|nr:glycosyltransferase family 2 protein [Gammaproteobacteria bacterium]
MTRRHTPERFDGLSVIVPVYNEQQVLPELYRRLGVVLNTLGMPSEILFVNDGGSDGSVAYINSLITTDSRVALIELSRNFGKEVAMSAGLDYARGEAVVIIDADLQDPPELIPELVAHWRAGYDVVYATRTSRAGESWLKKLTAFLFYRLVKRLGGVRIPPDTGDFRLLSRRAVNALTTLRERRRFMKGLYSWIGYRQIAVPYQRDQRFAGVSKWNYWRLWNLALEGITSFTTLPLRLATYVGLVTALGAFGYGAYTIIKTLLWGDPVPGYPSLMTVILFLGGMQLIGLGIIGEYLGRIFDESKGRPLYFVDAYQPSRLDANTAIDDRPPG